MRPEIITVVLAAGLSGCWTAELLEAPLVLAGGLDHPSVLTASARDELAVVTGKGILRVGLDGTVAALDERKPRAIAAHPKRLYLLTGDTLLATPPADGGTLQRTGVLDITAWCDGQVLLLTTNDLVLWHPDDGRVHPWAPTPEGANRIAVGAAEGCTSALVGTGTGTILQVTPDESTTLATGLGPVRAVSIDAHERVWALHGDPAALSEIRGSQTHTLTDQLGESSDLFVLPAPAGNAQHAYLADPAGSVDMVQLPPAKEPSSP